MIQDERKAAAGPCRLTLCLALPPGMLELSLMMLSATFNTSIFHGQLLSEATHPMQ